MFKIETEIRKEEKLTYLDVVTNDRYVFKI